MILKINMTRTSYPLRQGEKYFYDNKYNYIPFYSQATLIV